MSPAPVGSRSALPLRLASGDGQASRWTMATLVGHPEPPTHRPEPPPPSSSECLSLHEIEEVVTATFDELSLTGLRADMTIPIPLKRAFVRGDENDLVEDISEIRLRAASVAEWSPDVGGMVDAPSAAPPADDDVAQATEDDDGFDLPLERPRYKWLGLTLLVTVVTCAIVTVQVQRGRSATEHASLAGVRPPRAQVVIGAARSSAPPTPTAILPTEPSAIVKTPAPAAAAPSAVIAPPEVGLSSSELLHRANAALLEGDGRRAQQRFRLVLGRDPSNVEALTGLGEVARRDGDLAAAKKHYERALDRSPGFVPALISLADVTWDLGDKRAAQLRYATILERLGERAPVRARERAWKG